MAKKGNKKIIQECTMFSLNMFLNVIIKDIMSHQLAMQVQVNEIDIIFQNQLAKSLSQIVNFFQKVA